MMAKVKTGVAGTEQAQKKLVGIDVSDQQILQFNMMDDVELVWEGDAFRKLSEEVQNQLKPENLKRYLRADLAAEEKAEAFIRKTRVSNPFNPLQGEAEAREYIRARPGWHQCWKNPGREYDAAIMGPYKPIRKQKDGEEKEPGYEEGEVLKRVDADGKVEAIAVECPQELFEQYLTWMDSESTRRYKGLTEDFIGGIEEINRKTSKSDARIIPIVNGEKLED
jgi:hypothetical protein